MNNDIEFKSIKELYNRVLPALYSKTKEMKRLGYNVITEQDIWNYLADNIWKNKVNLELHDLISDILYTDNIKINEYVMNKLNSIRQQSSIMEINDLH